MDQSFKLILKLKPASTLELTATRKILKSNFKRSSNVVLSLKNHYRPCQGLINTDTANTGGCVYSETLGWESASPRSNTCKVNLIWQTFHLQKLQLLMFYPDDII